MSNTYAVVRKLDEFEVFRYEAPSGIEGEYPFDEYSHIALSYAALNTKRITRLAFFNRFTDTEAITIDLASMGATVEAASVRRYMQKVNAAENIDLAREETVGGVMSLEQVGILATGRSGIILNSYVKVHEMFDREFLDLPAYFIPEPEVIPIGFAKVYAIGENFVTILDSENNIPSNYTNVWEITAFQAKLIEYGAEIKKLDNQIEIIYSDRIQ